MTSRIEMIKKLLELTVTMNDALKKRNIDIIEQMLKEREILLEKYNCLSKSSFSDEEQSMVNELLKLDKENNVLLEILIKKVRVKADSMKKEKNDVKKRTSVAKKYITNASSVGVNSKFNKKT